MAIEAVRQCHIATQPLSDAAAASQRWHFKMQNVKFDKMFVVSEIMWLAASAQSAPPITAPDAALVRNLFRTLRAEGLTLLLTTLDVAASDYSNALSTLRRLLLAPSAAAAAGNRIRCAWWP
jgi:hypothetical protein